MPGKFLINHLIPLVLSIGIGFIIVFYTPARGYFVKYDTVPANASLPDTSVKYMINYDGGYRSEIALRNALNDGNAITVMGSSEMTTQNLPAIPYNFFNNHHIACLGFGHEGNQDFSIMAQLAVMHNELNKARMVIILSPGWFEGKYAVGTSLQSFLEYMNERFLYLLYFDSAIPAEIKDYVYSYVVRNFRNINSPPAILRLMYFTGLSEKSALHKAIYYPFCTMYKALCSEKAGIMTGLFNNHCSQQPFTNERYPFIKLKCNSNQKISWDSLKIDAVKDFAALSNNNLLGIENNYYDQWIRGKGKLSINAVDEKNNVELHDFEMLLKLLKAFNCRPLFIIQPLNPLVYKNMYDIDPVLSKIRQKLVDGGFDYLDLHTSDNKKYVKGTLNDFQHMGNLGWYETDEKIYNYFFHQ